MHLHVERTGIQRTSDGSERIGQRHSRRGVPVVGDEPGAMDSCRAGHCRCGKYGTVPFVVEANATGAPRVGTITIGGQVFTVTQ